MWQHDGGLAVDLSLPRVWGCSGPSAEFPDEDVCRCCLDMSSCWVGLSCAEKDIRWISDSHCMQAETASNLWCVACVWTLHSMVLPNISLHWSSLKSKARLISVFCISGCARQLVVSLHHMAEHDSTYWGTLRSLRTTAGTQVAWWQVDPPKWILKKCPQ